VDGSGIDSLEISRGGTRIRIAKTPAPGQAASAPAPSSHAREAAPVLAHHLPPAPAAAPAAAPAPAAEERLLEVKSPMVGTFYRSPSPEAPAYVEVGSRVARGQTLCILEAMKLMNELQAEVGGVVREVCVENAEPVEYGQVLFRIEPE
jgi:acetyl-CoA carboxylase biotin carboxyl carrier protein